MSMTGADTVVKALESLGVEIVFGYPGGAALPLYDALYRSPVRHILTRGEQAAAHAASGYAHTTGRVGVCSVTSGPGATNLITGLATAYMDSVPLVAFTGQVPTHLIGKDVFQEVDITGATTPFVKHNYLVRDPASLPQLVAEAFYIAATGRPGPVLIDLPRDVAQSSVEYQAPGPVKLRGYNPTTQGHPLQISRALEALAAAQQPVILAGGGANSARAWDELYQLATRLQVPVITSLMGLSSFPGDHPLNLGMSGMHGTPAASRAVQESDLLLAVGARFGDRLAGKFTDFAPYARVVHIDIDPAEIGKNISSHISIVGDVKQVLQAFLQRLESTPIPEVNQDWVRQLQQVKQDTPLPDESVRPRLSPRLVLERVSAAMAADAVVSTEVGQHQMWAAHYLTLRAPGSFVTSGGLGTMGYGLPAALGAQMAMPERQVLVISGDGSLQMNMAEMATAVENQLPVKIMLLNNSCLGMVRQLQDGACESRHSAVHFTGNPDFVRLAEAFGLRAQRVEEPEKIDEALRQSLDHPGPSLLEFVICPHSMVYPGVPQRKIAAKEGQT